MFVDESLAADISNEEINSPNEGNIEESNVSNKKNEQKLDDSDNLSNAEVKNI